MEEEELPVLQVDRIIKGARILLILDYPRSDATIDNPTTGSEGTILATCASTAGIAINSCSLVFVIDKPNTNKTIYEYFTPKGGFTTSGLSYLDALRRKITEANPTVIVPVGELALQAVSSRRSIEKWRGSVLESSLVIGKKCIPTLHPRDSFKRYLLRYFIAADFKKIQRESLFHAIKLRPRFFHINPSFNEVIGYLNKIYEEKLKVASDIECPVPKVIKDKETGESKIYGTKGITCISFSHDYDYGMSIPFNNFIWTEEEELEIWTAIARVFEEKLVETVWQNGAAFDAVYLFSVHDLILRGPIHDTLVKANILYPEFPKSLAFLTSIRTDIPYYKDDGKEVDINGVRNWDTYYTYNAKDSVADFEINDSLDEELVKFKNEGTWDFAQALIEPLIYMQVRGLKVDIEKLRLHREDAKVNLKEEEKKLYELAGRELNVGSSKQMIEFFYEEKGYKKIIKMVKDKESGERKETITCDNKAMTKLARIYDCPIARQVKKVRALKKLISTYLMMPFDSDQRLRCTFKMGTKFFRLSSSKSIFKTGGNSQNIPKPFKSFLIADEGKLAFEIDLSQAEWVVSAYAFNDPQMIAAIEQGLDIHVHTANLMYGVPKELIEKEDEILGSCTEESEIIYKRETQLPEIIKFNPPVFFSCRQAGKKCNHSFNYGLSDMGFCNNYDLPKAEGRRCFTSYHAAYKGIKKGHKWIVDKLNVDRTLVNPFGWVRRFMDRLDDNTYKQGYAFYGQSTVGMLLNKGIIKSYYNQYETDKEYMRNLDLLNQVHDSVVGQGYYDNLENYARMLLRIKENLTIPLTFHGRTFTIKCDCKVGFDLKNMEKVKWGSLEDVTKQLEEIIPKLKGYEKLPELEVAIEETLEQEQIDEENERIYGKEEWYGA